MVDKKKQTKVVKVSPAQEKAKNSKPDAKNKDVKPKDKVLSDGPLATVEAGRVEKTDKPVVKLTKEEAVADATAEVKMFKDVEKEAKTRKKTATVCPITGVIVVK